MLPLPQCYLVPVKALVLVVLLCQNDVTSVALSCEVLLGSIGLLPKKKAAFWWQKMEEDGETTLLLIEQSCEQCEVMLTVVILNGEHDDVCRFLFVID